MAIFTAITAIVSAVVGAFGAIGTFIGGLGAIGSFALKTIVGLGISLIQQAIAGEPEKPRFAMQGQLRSGGDVPRSFMMGYYATAGSLTWANTWGNNNDSPNAYLYQVIALSDLPVDGLVTIWVNGERCTIDLNAPVYDGSGHLVGYPVEEYRVEGNSYILVNFYDGTQTVADPHLVERFQADQNRPYDVNRVGTGVAYAIVRSQIKEDLFSGFPTFRFELTGVRLYDPSRDDTVGGTGAQRYNDPSTWGGDGDSLPAVQIYNILRGLKFAGQWFYGLQNINPNRIPTVPIINEIEKCRALIDGPDGPEPTYRTGGEILITAKIIDAVQAILTGCQGRISETGGFYRLNLGIPNASVASFTDGDILSTEQQSFSPIFGLADSINGVVARYPSPVEGWNVRPAPPLIRTDLEERDGNRRLPADVSLDMVPYPGQVQRLMLSALNEAQRARRHTFVMPPKFWTLEPGDVVSWTSERNGYVNKLFRVDGAVDRANLDVMLDLTEIDPADYDWNQATDYTPPVIAPVGPIRPPALPMVGWQVGPAILEKNGNKLPSIRVDFAGDVQDVQNVQIQVRFNDDQEITFDGIIPYGELGLTGSLKSVILNGTFLPNTIYDVRGKFVRASDQLSTWSAWISVTTPNVWISGGPVDLDQLADDFKDYQKWIGEGLREVKQRLMELDTWVGSQDFGNEYERQQIREQVTATFDNARAEYTREINVIAAQNFALSARIEQLDAEVFDPVTGLPAVASAVDILEAEVTDSDHGLIALANAVTSLSAADVAGNVNTTNMRMEVKTGPTGYSQIGFEARQGGTGDWRAAGWFLQVPNDPQLPTRMFVNAEQFIVGDGTTLDKVFAVIGGAVWANELNVDWAKIQNVSIGTAQIEDAAITSAKIDDLAVTSAKIGDLAVDTIKLAGTAINVTNSAYTAGGISVSFTQLTVQSVTLNVPSDALFVRCIFTAQTSNLSFIPVFNFYVDGNFLLTDKTERSPFQREFVWMTPTPGVHTFEIKMYAQGAGAGQGWDVTQRRLHVAAQRR